MTQTKEERNAKQREAGKLYRDNLSPERKAEIAAQKRNQAIANKEKNIVKRKLYYEANKEHMQANSKEYHRKMRADKKAQRDAAVEINGVTYSVRVRTPKVIHQPAGMMVLKDIAKSVGMLTPQFRSLSREPKYKFPEPTMIRMDGMDLYDVFEITAWAHLHKEALTNASILGSKRKSTTKIRLSKKVMLLINWLQETKHISAYAATLRQTAAEKAHGITGDKK